MSETQNEYVAASQDEADEQDSAMAVEGVEQIELSQTPIIQAREVILPVIMRKGEDIAVLGEATYDPETSKMVVHYNTPAGRDIAEFIGSGMLAAISFNGHMSKSTHFKN